MTAKAEMAQDTLKQESDNIDKTLESQEAYESSKSRIHKVVDFMLAEPKALAEMLGFGWSIYRRFSSRIYGILTVLAVGTASRKVDRDQLTDWRWLAFYTTTPSSNWLRLQNALDDLPKDKKPAFRKHPELAVEHVAGKAVHHSTRDAHHRRSRRVR